MARSAWGNITKLEKGVYKLRYPLPPKNGKRRQGSETVHGTQKEAVSRLNEIRQEITCSTFSKDTVGQFFYDVFLPECQENLAVSTVRGYRDVYKTHIEPTFGNVSMRDITGSQVQKWLSSKSYGSARHCKAVMSSIMGRAFALDKVPQNVMARRYRLPQNDKRVVKNITDVYTLDELMSIFKMCEGEIWEPAYILAAFGGARREEACSPRLDEIVFEYKDGLFFASVEIVRGFQHIDGEVVEVKPKTPDSHRWLIIPEPYSLRLHEIVQEMKESGYTWLMDDGADWVISPNTMAAAYKRWFLDKPIKYIPFKNLRNAYVTYMHSQGIELSMISKLLGHTTQQTTFRHYDRPGKEQLMGVVSGHILDTSQGTSLDTSSASL